VAIATKRQRREKTMVDYAKAIMKPFSNMTTLVIGMVIGAIPVLNLLVTGYGLKVGQKTIKGDSKLPEWSVGDLVDYIVKLIMYIIIVIVYLLPGAIITAVGALPIIGAIISAAMSGSMDPTIFMSALASGGVLMLIGVLILLIGAILSIMAIASYLASNNIMAAFNVGKVLKKTLTASFIISLIVLIIYGMVLAFIVGVITVILMLIPVIGWLLIWLLTGALMYIASVTSWTIFGEVFKETK